MTVTNRLGLNFDKSKFGDAKELSQSAANSLNLIATTQGPIPSWQQTDLSAGRPVRSNYFKNPTQPSVSAMITSTTTIHSTAQLVSDSSLSTASQNLLLELNAFKSHTDNVSGVVAVTDTTFPSLQSAQNMGQLNMMTLARCSEGVSDTTPILGSYTSLFINDVLSERKSKIEYYANEYSNSIIEITEIIDPEYGTTQTSYSSSLSYQEILDISNYLTDTKNILSTRRLHDWNFYTNTMELSQDVGFMQQFSNMGGTMKYLVNNVVGTTRLLNNLK